MELFVKVLAKLVIFLMFFFLFYALHIWQGIEVTVIALTVWYAGNILAAIQE